MYYATVLNFRWEICTCHTFLLIFQQFFYLLHAKKIPIKDYSSENSVAFQVSYACISLKFTQVPFYITIYDLQL